MIQGQTNTEANYRAVMLDSSSSLKDFSLDRKKYHRKYILNQVIEEKDSSAANMGRLVETILMEPHLFEEKFFLSSCVSTPTGLMLEFVEALYRVTRDATDESGNVSRDFESLSREAYDLSSFKIKYEAVINKFVGSDAELYYDEIRKVRTNNLTVVSSLDIIMAEKIVETIKRSSVTSGIVNLVDSVRYSVLNQLQVENYSVFYHNFKSMMDKVVVDHEEETIQVYDLKCTWNVENFFEEYYLYRRSYIQAYLYKKAAEHIPTQLGSEYQGYTVLNPRFIVCDSANYYSPLVYTLSDKDMLDAEQGFEYKGRTYPGVESLTRSLKWATDNNIWHISEENFLSDGIINIRTQWK
jgi:hypothetical protein